MKYVYLLSHGYLQQINNTSIMPTIYTINSRINVLIEIKEYRPTTDINDI